MTAGEAPFQVALEQKDGVLSARIIGKLNEDARLDEITAYLAQPVAPVSRVDFDLSGVTLLNSCGIRTWLYFLERMQTRMPCSFSLLCELFVEQASVVPNILGKPGTPVVTFEAPYFCQPCKERVMIHLETADIPVGGSFTAPDRKCPKCGGAMEFDALEDEYFNFLAHSR